jgi:hypothetical protein
MAITPTGITSVSVQKFGTPSVYTTSRVNQVNPQVEFQLPEFIQEDHRQFIDFIRNYYRFMESNGGPLEFLRRLLSLQNIDETTNELLDYFFREYAPSFPRATILSPAILIKNIREFYLAKGSEKSFKLLFRVFFGQDVEFYYPRLDILRFSDAKWIQNRTIKCVLINGDPSQLIGNRIIGTSSKANAFVEKVFLVRDGSITTYELFLNRSSISGKFKADEVIKNENGSVNLRVTPIIAKIDVTNPGAGYQVGQDLTISGVGFNCKARVRAVGVEGEVKKVEIYRFGAGYSPSSTIVSFPTYDGVTIPAQGVAVFDTLTKYTGYFTNSDGMLSSLKRIQDGYYWQQYSYVIRSEESRNQYDSIVERVVHPAGYIFFSEVVNESRLDASAQLPFPDTEIEIFTDLRLDYNEFETNASEYIFLNAEADPNAETDVKISVEDVLYDSTNLPLGPSWADWDKWKTDYRPTPIFGQPEDDLFEADYYAKGNGAHTPLKAFADVKLADITFNETQSINDLSEVTATQAVSETYDSVAEFPTSGINGTIYLDSSTKKMYFWDDSIKDPDTGDVIGGYAELE